jgi:hypothetical protein
MGPLIPSELLTVLHHALPDYVETTDDSRRITIRHNAQAHLSIFGTLSANKITYT